MCPAKSWEASDNTASMKSDFKKGDVTLNVKKKWHLKIQISIIEENEHPL